MRAANYVEETTISIAGTAGDGAITLTAITNTPRFSSALGTQATTIRYAIEDTVGLKFETGIGSVASNVLTRTRPQITWNGSVYNDQAPSAMQFGSAPTSGNIRVRMAATAESQHPTMPGRQTTITADSTWRDYHITNNLAMDYPGGASPLTADTEYYTVHQLLTAGLLTGCQFEVLTAGAGSALKLALYSIGSNGLPTQKIVDFTTTSTASTGVKTDTATASWSPASPVWLTPGWYAIGFICNATAPAIRGVSCNQIRPYESPFGRGSNYGMGMTISNSGSYASGLPSSPSLGGASLVGPSVNLSVPWIGLKVST